MRPRVALIWLFASALGACAVDTSGPARLGYAPPEEQPTETGPAAAGQPAGLIWNQLLDRLIQADLEIDLADPERGIIVARYSGDPEPYVTCGWILVDRGGELEEIPASGATSFKRVVQGRRLEVNRDLNLDARLVVEVNPDGDGAAVETTSNYVLTKTVAAANQAGWTPGPRPGSRQLQQRRTWRVQQGYHLSTERRPRAHGAGRPAARDPGSTGGDAGPAAMDVPVAGSGPAARLEVAESGAPARSTQATRAAHLQPPGRRPRAPR